MPRAHPLCMRPSCPQCMQLRPEHVLRRRSLLPPPRTVFGRIRVLFYVTVSVRALPRQADICRQRA